jgi:hypothetical protein
MGRKREKDRQTNRQRRRERAKERDRERKIEREREIKIERGGRRRILQACQFQGSRGLPSLAVFQVLFDPNRTR